MRRVLVIGPGGAGKSWLATRLGEITRLPVVHLDVLYWRPGWEPTPDTEWRQTVAREAAKDRWIMDGNYGGSLDIRLAACDTVVFLDMPRRVTIARVLRRWLAHRGFSRPDMAPGCPERLSWEFLAWIWNYPRRRRPQIRQRLAELGADRRVWVLRSNREIADFLAEVQRSQPT